MGVSGANNNHKVQAPPPKPPPAKTEPAAQKPAEQKPVDQKQPTQHQTDRQKDKYEEPKKGQENKAAAQANPSGQTPHEQRNAGGTDAQDSVPELGGTSSSTGTDKSGEGKNKAGTDKQSATELLKNSKVDGKQNYNQLSPEDKGADYGQQKKDLYKAATDAGASKEEAAIMTSQFMLEGGRDASKDNDPKSKNYGPLNLNGDLLDQQKFSQADKDEMNKLENGKPTQKALDLTAKAAHQAIQDMGANGYLHHVRGGQTGFDKPNQKVDPSKPGLHEDDPSAFARTVAESAKQYLANGLDDNKRYAANIPPI